MYVPVLKNHEATTRLRGYARDVQWEIMGARASKQHTQTLSNLSNLREPRTGHADTHTTTHRARGKREDTHGVPSLHAALPLKQPPRPSLLPASLPPPVPRRRAHANRRRAKLAARAQDLSQTPPRRPKMFRSARRLLGGLLGRAVSDEGEEAIVTDLDRVDVEHALARRDEAEVDRVRERPHLPAAEDLRHGGNEGARR